MTEDHSVEDRLRRTLRAHAGQPIPPAPPVFDPRPPIRRRRVQIVGVMLIAVAVAAAVTLAVAFGPRSGPGGNTTHQPTPATSPPPRQAVVTTTTSTTTTTTTTTTMPVASSTIATTPASTGVSLGADGLGVVQVGDAQANAVRTLTSYLGAPSMTTTSGPCTSRTEVEWGDLSVEFYGGVLDGYRYLDGGLSAAGTENPPTGAGSPVLKTAAGATLGMTLAQARSLYPADDFSEEEGGAIVVAGTKEGDRLFLGFFDDTASTPLTEIKGGQTCGDV